jgi:hypothetical protein
LPKIRWRRTRRIAIGREGTILNGIVTKNATSSAVNSVISSQGNLLNAEVVKVDKVDRAVGAQVGVVQVAKAVGVGVAVWVDT